MKWIFKSCYLCCFRSKLVPKVKSYLIFLKFVMGNKSIILRSMMWRKFVNFNAFFPSGRKIKSFFNHFGPSAVAGIVLWSRVCPSFRASFRAFSSNCIINFFLNYDMVLGTHMKLCVTAGFSWKKILLQKLGKWTKNGSKTRFSENCVLAQSPYSRKFWFLRYEPKCSQPIRLQDFLIKHISRSNQWNSLIFCMLIQIHMCVASLATGL